MVSRTSACVIALSCLSLAPAASAQPAWGRERPPEIGACFYEDRSLRGRYFCVGPDERLQSLPDGVAGAIVSVRVVGSAVVTVFRDAGLRGRSARFLASVQDLKREGWNDQIASLLVERTPAGQWRAGQLPSWSRSQSLPREGACFYQNADFQGDYFCVPRGAAYPTLPRGINEQISSIRVFGADVRIFQNQNFFGRSLEIRSDVPNLRGSWPDNVSSFRVF